MDLEMTGLDPFKDVIIEIATVVTDGQLNVVETGPHYAIRRDPALFETMDDWNKTTHTKTGLWSEVIKSTVSEEQAEKETLAFIQRFTKPRQSPLCGNSIWQDRRFLARYMKSIDEHLHYRLIDVSTIKELAGIWYPRDEKYTAKKGNHRALDDIMESIEELKFYRTRFFRSI